MKAAVNEVFVLWTGGWDIYVVDPQQIREMTDSEVEEHESGNMRYFPNFCAEDGTWWIKGKFLTSRNNQEVAKVTITQCIRQTGHTAGGD